MKVNVSKYIRLSVILFFVIVISNVFANSIVSVQAAVNKGDILGNNKVSIPSDKDVASSKYAVIAQFTRGSSKLIYSGPTRKMSVNNRALVVEPANNQKGKIRALYTNIGTYKGRTLNFELVATDWVKAGFNGGEFMHFYDTHIGFNQGGYSSVSLQGTYIYADTGKPATDLTGSYMTVNDLDANQFMGFSKDMYDKIDEMYAYNNSWVSLWKEKGKINIGARFHEALDSDDKRGFVTFLVSGHQFNFDWHKDWTRPSSNNQHYNFNRVLDWYTEASAQYFGYKSEKPIRTEVLEPTKTIINSAGKSVKENTVTGSDTYSYNLFHSVPSEYPEFFYKSYKVEDEIDGILDIESVKVYDSANKDVSKNFNISTKNNAVVIIGKNINKKDFYGKDYRFAINVKVKDPEELIWITEGKPSYKFNNKASVSTNNGVKDTNIVNTTINYSPEDLMIQRCHVGNLKSENVSGITKNDVNVTKGYLPEGFTDFQSKMSEYRNESHQMLANDSKRPKKGWSESEWNTWKNKFKQGDIETSAVNLSDITGKIQKYGGVLNVTRTHYTSEIDVQLCQNQQRTPNYPEKKWEWKDKGGKEIHEIKEIKYNVSNKKDSYQILGVNCNADGVEKVKEDFKVNYNIEDHSHDLNSNASRLIIVRPKDKGTPFPLGKSSHYTGQNNFFNPDGEVWENSCELDFNNACKSTKLSGGENDANNNLSGDKLNLNKTFSEVEFINNDEVGHSLPNKKNQLVFFRDNKERQIRADVWYLDIDDETYSSDKKSSAKVTDIRIFGGSPEIDITDVEPWKKDMNEIPKVDKMNKDFSFNKQHINRINIKSKWASTSGKPYKIGIAWTYVAQGTNVGFTEVDGYGGKSKEVESYEFDAICAFHKKPGEYQAVLPRGNVFKDGKVNLDDKWNSSETIEVLFTRSISTPVNSHK